MANLSVITGNSGGVKKVTHYDFNSGQVNNSVAQFSSSNAVTITAVDDVNKTALVLNSNASNGSNAGLIGIKLASTTSVQYIMNHGDPQYRHLSFEVIEYN